MLGALAALAGIGVPPAAGPGLTRLFAGDGKARVRRLLVRDRDVVVFPSVGAPLVWDGEQLAPMDPSEAATYGAGPDDTPHLLGSVGGRRLAVVERSGGGLDLRFAPFEADARAIRLEVDGALALPDTDGPIVGVDHGSGPDTLRFYSATGAPGRDLELDEVQAVDMSTGGDRVEVRTPAGILVYDGEGTLLYTLPAAGEHRSSPDGRWHALFRARAVVVYEEAEERFSADLAGLPLDAAFAANAPVLAVVDRTAVYRFDLQQGREIWRKTGSPRAENRSVAIGADGDTIVVGTLHVVARAKRAEGAHLAGEASARIVAYDVRGEPTESETFETASWTGRSPRVRFGAQAWIVHAVTDDAAYEWNLGP